MNNLIIIAHIILSVLSWGLTVYAIGGVFLNLFGLTELQYSYLLLCALIGNVVVPIIRFKLPKIDAFKYHYKQYLRKNK